MQKQLYTLSALLLAGIAGNAQVDTTYNTTYYGQKVSQFRQIPDTDKDEIIFLGDSITDIGEWAELLNNKKVKNRGISSDVTFGVLNRLDEVTHRKPSKIFILIGINDIAKNTPDSIILSNYMKIVNRMKTESPGTKIFIQSIFPTNNEFTEFKRHQDKDAHIQTVNKGLQFLAQQAGCTYIDLYHLLINKEGKLDKRYTNDGLHLTGDGYMVWKNELLSKKYL